jgi:hypothetical protein
MAKQGGTRRLSRTDTLALAALSLLLAALVPVLFAKPRERASRVLCGANLGRIGKAMLIYANDYEDELPHPGTKYTTWGPLANWLGRDRKAAYGVNDADPWDPSHSDGQASFSSSFYLLVKYCGVPPRLFICPSDVGAQELNLSELPPGTVPSGCRLADLWDFGPTMSEATKACSYSYQVPFGLYGLTLASDPNSPVAADRNPWLNSPAADAKWFPGAGTGIFWPDIEPYGGSAALGRNGNAITHQKDGQNVLFLDGRVTFETRAYCGIAQDNIYTVSDRPPDGSVFGTAPLSSSVPMDRKDSLLLQDDFKSSSGVPPRR